MIIYAVNINTGGGKVLLDRLLEDNPFEKSTAAFLDTRYTPPPSFKGKVFSFIPTLTARLLAEFKLHTFIATTQSEQSILFFGNLPPFFKPRGKSILYLQNCYLTRQVPLPKDSFKEKLRNLVESWLLKMFYSNVDEIWVQTPWMAKITQAWTKKANIKIKPFLPLLPLPKPKIKKAYKFIFVGSLSINKGLSEFLSARIAQ